MNKFETLIGISGKIGSGKDLLGKLIIYHLYNHNEHFKFKDVAQFEAMWAEHKEVFQYNNWCIKKFAYKLKQVVSLLTGVPVAEMEKREVKNSKLESHWDYQYLMENKLIKVRPYDKHETIYQYSVRELLQLIGTDLFRNNVHENVWINALFSDFNTQSKWVVTDVRFKNEAMAISRRNGLLIRINDIHKDSSAIEHSSETDLDGFGGFNITIQNDKKAGIKMLSELVKDEIIPKIR